MSTIPDFISDEALFEKLGALVALIPADKIEEFKKNVRESLDLTIHAEKWSGKQVADFEEDVGLRIGIHAGYHITQLVLPEEVV